MLSRVARIGQQDHMHSLRLMYRVKNIETVRTSKNNVLHAVRSQLATIIYKTIKLQVATAMKSYVKLGLRQLKRELTLCRRTLKLMTLVSKETGNPTM